LGVLAVALIYRLLAARMGPLAGLAGALALAVFPSFVAVSRDNGVDSLLIVLMILACGAGMRAPETGRRRALIWSGVLVGLAVHPGARVHVRRPAGSRAAAPGAPGRGGGPPGASAAARRGEADSRSRSGREKQPIPFGGPPGPLRLFGVGLGDQGAWIVPFAA